MSQQIRNEPVSTATIVEPTGVPVRIEMIMPENAQITERTAEKTVTDLKLRKSRIAESAGNLIKADTKRDPQRFMAITIMTAMITASRRLYLPAFVPAETAKSSSKVTAKILL